MASDKRRRTPTPMREVKSPVVRSDAPLPSVEPEQPIEPILVEPEQPVASTSVIPQLTVTSPGSSSSAQEHPANKPARLSVSPSPEPPTPEVSPEPAPKRPRRQAASAKGKAPALEVVAKRIKESTPGRRSRESSVASSTGATAKPKKKAESRKSSAAPVSRRATRQSNAGDKKLAVLAFPTRRELNAATGIGSGRRRTSRLADKLRDDCDLPCTPLWALVRPSTSDFDPTTLRESAVRWHDESD